MNTNTFCSGSRVPKRYWENEYNRKEFFDGLGVKLGYSTMDDWYRVTLEDIHRNGGGGLMAHVYSNSPSKAL